VVKNNVAVVQDVVKKNAGHVLEKARKRPVMEKIKE
jgi:hypothetical protein